MKRAIFRVLLLVTGCSAKPPRPPVLVILAFHTALLISPIAALLSVATYVPKAEAKSLATAAGLALASLSLVALCWLRLPRPIRVLAVGILLLSGSSLALIVDRFLR